MMRSSGVEKALGYSIFTIHSNTQRVEHVEVIRKLIKQIKYCYEKSHYNGQRGSRVCGGGVGKGVVSLKRHLAKTI